MAEIPAAALPGAPVEWAPMVFRRHSADRLSLTRFMFMMTVSRLRNHVQSGCAVGGIVSMTIPVQWIPWAVRRSEKMRRVNHAGSRTLICTEAVSWGLSVPLMMMVLDWSVSRRVTWSDWPAVSAAVMPLLLTVT